MSLSSPYTYKVNLISHVHRKPKESNISIMTFLQSRYAVLRLLVLYVSLCCWGILTSDLRGSDAPCLESRKEVDASPPIPSSSPSLSQHRPLRAALTRCLIFQQNRFGPAVLSWIYRNSCSSQFSLWKHFFLSPSNHQPSSCPFSWCVNI